MSRAARQLEIANLHGRLRVNRASLSRALRTLDTAAAAFRGGCPPGTLSVAFLNDPALAGLHARHLGDPSPTDVITFEGDAQHGTAGEICVSVDAAERMADRRSPFAAELALYIVHGWLHLAGFDDRTPKTKRAMRRAEGAALSLLARSRAMPRFRLA